jgi:hypothetical protein
LIKFKKENFSITVDNFERFSYRNDEQYTNIIEFHKAFPGVSIDTFVIINRISEINTEFLEILKKLDKAFPKLMGIVMMDIERERYVSFDIKKFDSLLKFHTRYPNIELTKISLVKEIYYDKELFDKYYKQGKTKEIQMYIEEDLRQHISVSDFMTMVEYSGLETASQLITRVKSSPINEIKNM